ncbi:thymidylate synthase [uncultured Salinicola sp.]|uniref:thymidylate synthase n=1 Tax=uncultured Salinicola sp. TaxID=1193542 RepID=UPI0026105678|nr:thymidylate synthase [uncultured Salinicola sp.]|tara:strand:+ start:4973 stop:5890 length:918 start_codon:yes stop_codon:yes gene_type:complete
MKNIEEQYLELIRNVHDHGDERVDRTGVGTRSVFGAMLRHDMGSGTFPLLTTKRVYWKTAVREMLWFLTGQTNIRALLENGVSIWSEWPHKKYVMETGEQISLEDFERRIVQDEGFASQWGDLGPVYGKQWVDWDTYEPAGEGLFRKGPGIDQVTKVIEDLRTNPTSRRHIIEGWNVAQLDEMALPPCHKSYQFHVDGGRLNCLLYQRSCDMFLGLPFNLAGQATLTSMIAQQAGLEAGEIVWMGGDVHVYLNHGDAIAEQIDRETRDLPVLHLTKAKDIHSYRIDDFVVTGYDPHPPIKAPVAV